MGTLLPICHRGRALQWPGDAGNDLSARPVAIWRNDSTGHFRSFISIAAGLYSVLLAPLRTSIWLDQCFCTDVLPGC